MQAYGYIRLPFPLLSFQLGIPQVHFLPELSCLHNLIHIRSRTAIRLYKFDNPTKKQSLCLPKFLEWSSWAVYRGILRLTRQEPSQ